MPVRRVLLIVVIILLAGAGLFTLYTFTSGIGNTAIRNRRLSIWLRESSNHPDWRVNAGNRCNDAPFLMPTDGFIGFLWNDSFRPGHHHQGVDIFGGSDVGSTPVVAAYSGYLTRRPDWKSSLILRVPQDPLQPDRQIWLYYTHLADVNGRSFIVDKFPPGTSEVPVEAGELLGFQGNYSGDPGNPVGVHLHFSIVLDDGTGSFRNELKINNTLDPSAYLGVNLNGQNDPEVIPVCTDTE